MRAGVLTERTCLITGATGGLGAAIARAFWSEGASLLLTGRAADQLGQLAADLGEALFPEQRLLTVRADLSDPEGPRRIAATALEAFGRITVLVNNAGRQGPIGRLPDVSWGDWEKTLQVNLLAPAQLCAEVIPAMRQQGYGKIINLSGGGAAGPRANFSAYAASKAALVRLTETIANEEESHGIRANAIAPGTMKTRMLEEVLIAGPRCAGEAEYLRAQQQGGSSDSTALPARLAVFLASSDGDGITGRLLSAVWDQWELLPLRSAELRDSDIYTLRRIVPEDRPARAWK